MRRDRDGSPLEQHDDELDTHLCVDGWLGFDADERPVPCLTCRPHLLAARRVPALAR